MLSRSDHLRAALFSSVVRGVVWFVGHTMRLRTHNEACLGRWRRLGPGRLLFALWHGDFFPVLHYAQGSNVCIVVSRSPDGEILARILRARGYQTVRGSNTRGATRAVIDLARVVQRGSDAAVAIDGPRGPALAAKAGIVLMAKVTGCPIIPLGVGMSRFKEFASWDRFRLPLPFSRAVIAAGPPIQVAADAPGEVIEAKRRELEQSMLALRSSTQEMVEPGRFPGADRPRGITDSWTSR